MRGLIILLCCGAASLVATPSPAISENRESYLARLKDICEIGCLQPRELLRTARKRRASEQRNIAGILDIAYVSREGSKYLLHERAPNLFDMSELDFGLPQLDQSPIENVNGIVIEMDEQTASDFLNGPPAAVSSGDGNRGEGDIVVEGDRTRKAVTPSVDALESLFRNRRVVVLGTPRLDVGFVGARRDRRQKKLTMMLGRADDLVLLPRYYKNGEPILEGPLLGLGQP